MSERKVLNKYFPPNFDPSKIPKQKKPKDLQHKVRLMAPFSMRCESCGEYIYKGKKFNARKETVVGEKYLSIQVFRFYIRCPRCSAELTFKTSPKDADYVAENGVTRTFGWQRQPGEEDDEEDEEDEDAMASLESRTLESRREMEIMDALDEIRTNSSRAERVSIDDVLERLSAEARAAVQEKLDKEEEALQAEAEAVFKSADGETVRKMGNDEAMPADAISLVRQQQEEKQQKSLFAKQDTTTATTATKRKAEGNKFGVVVKKKMAVAPNSSKSASIAPKTTAAAPKASALSLVAAYDGSDTDSD
ncbi:CWC16 protein [Gongronella butleri]|nr:CWC16 protein [Gongronella butleri]